MAVDLELRVLALEIQNQRLIDLILAMLERNDLYDLSFDVLEKDIQLINMKLERQENYRRIALNN
jgi:hypothetical protein